MKPTADYTKHIKASLALIALGALIAGYFTVVMLYISRDKNEITCDNIVTEVKNHSSNILITSKGLDRIVRRSFPDLMGTNLSQLNLDQMERKIEETPAVKKCDIYTTLGGKVHVSITQREPIMRVFTNDASYYLDADTFRIPAYYEMRTHIIVVNGNSKALSKPKDIMSMCTFINADDFWKSQIEQVNITDKNEFILVPRIGNHVIEFGDISNMENKFRTLHTLYTKGWTPKEWNLYKKVSLKYKGQVVCTKR